MKLKIHDRTNYSWDKFWEKELGTRSDDNINCIVLHHTGGSHLNVLDGVRLESYYWSKPRGSNIKKAAETGLYGAIPYHYLIGKEGDIAHVTYNNIIVAGSKETYDKIHIAMLGNYGGDGNDKYVVTPTKKTVESAAKLIAYLMEIYKIRDVIGHFEVKDTLKACPRILFRYKKPPRKYNDMPWYTSPCYPGWSNFRGIVKKDNTRYKDVI